MRWPLAIVLLACAACSPGIAGSPPTPSSVARAASPSAQASPSIATTPAPIPLPSNLAVLVDLFAGGNAYEISLVAADGRVVVRAPAQKRAAIEDAVELPYVSTSSSRVYYVDGDHEVRFLTAGGASGFATSVPGTAHVHAVFAITPDDSRIAVATLDYSTNPVKVTLYVEDLGGTHRSVIYTSTSDYAWPVGWHAGKLVVASISGPPFNGQATKYLNGDLTYYPYGPNPYGAVNYRLINPVTGEREVIIGNGATSGLLTKAGTAVMQLGAADWNGSYRSSGPNAYEVSNALGSLSPSGEQIAVIAQDGRIIIILAQGYVRDLREVDDAYDWIGWFDDGHIITGFYQRSAGTPSVTDIHYDPAIALFFDKNTPVDAHGIVVAMLPGSLDT